MRANKRPPGMSKKSLILSLLVIALSGTVILVRAEGAPDTLEPKHGGASSPVLEAIKPPASESKPDALTPAASTELIHSDKQTKLEAKSEEPAKPAEAAKPAAEPDSKGSIEPDSQKRKARADAEASVSKTSGDSGKPDPAKPAETPKASPTNSKTDAKPSNGSRQQAAKGQANKATTKKQPSNLGTVTSTGSGGPSHYMSKHDAYSAIAEKHGSLASEAMKKADKRNLNSLSGIQKASGLGDMLSPFKGVTDSGLARTLGASMRSIMKSKYSVPAYVASALLGAVALMAFYESPISPLPVPPLPEPPVGRFPPELASLPPGTQVPFRPNPQQYGAAAGNNYNQRSFGQMMQPAASNQQSQQQILFPGATGTSERRQLNPMGGPVMNLLGKQQVAQRKSAPDYDPSSSRSLFGLSAGQPADKLAGPANQLKSTGFSFLSLFGLGSASQSGDLHTAGSSQHASGQHSGLTGMLSAQNNAAAAAGLNLVSRVRSLFSRATPSNVNQASPVQPGQSAAFADRVSFMQTLLRDTTSLFSGNRKSSSSPVSAAAANQQQANNNKVSNSAAQAQVGPGQSNGQTLARMQVDGNGQTASAGDKRASAGHLISFLVDSLLMRSAPMATDQLMAQRSDQINVAAANNNIQQQQQQQQQSQHQSVATYQGPMNVAQDQTNSEAVKSTDVSSVAQSRSADDDQSTASQTKQQDQTLQQADSPAAPATNVAHSRKTRSIGHEYPTSNQDFYRPQPSRADQINGVIDFVSDSYAQNKVLFDFLMNQVGLSQAVPYVEQILAPKSGQQ